MILINVSRETFYILFIMGFWFDYKDIVNIYKDTPLHERINFKVNNNSNFERSMLTIFIYDIDILYNASNVMRWKFTSPFYINSDYKISELSKHILDK